MSAVDRPAAQGRRILLRRFAIGAVLVALAAPGIRALAAETTVSIDNFTFSPDSLTVTRGATVTWVNHDDIPHAIYFAGINVRSHAMDTNDSFGHRFDQAGTYDYICSIHPHMKGRIVVSG
jgi:plastocyanin